MFRQLIRPLSRASAFQASKFALARPVARPVWSTFQTRFNSSDNQQTLGQVKQQLMLAFTCNKCEERSSHVFSKQAYTHGSVLVQCPKCKNRHLIADNLKIFRDNNVNVEELLKAKGESVATSYGDLVFEDIPESLKSSIGHYAKDAPEEYQKDPTSTALPESEKK